MTRPLRHFAKVPKRQSPIGLAKHKFWEEFRRSRQARAQALKLAIEKFREKTRGRNHSV